MTTLACGLCQSSRLIPYQNNQIQRCLQCGLLMTTPWKSADELISLYNQGYYSASADARRFRLGLADGVMRLFRRTRARRIARRLGKPAGQNVLDVGCGRGDMLQALQQMGYQVFGTQLSVAAASFAESQLGVKNIFVGDLLEAQYPASSFDFISLYHVLEHMADPVAQLGEVHRILKPNGLLYVEVPNAGGWPCRWFGKRWLAWDLPRHRFHFTPDTLMKMGKICGFTVVQRSFFSWEYSPPTLLQSILNFIFQDDSMLFRYFASDQSEPVQRGPIQTLKVSIQAVVAVLLVLPVVLFSLILGWLRVGDTMGFTFRKVKR